MGSFKSCSSPDSEAKKKSIGISQQLREVVSSAYEVAIQFKAAIV